MEKELKKGSLYDAKNMVFVLLISIIFLLAGCGSGKSTNSSANSINKDKELTDIQKGNEEEIKFDLESVKKQGFIISGTPSDTVPEGYIGIYTLEDLKKISDNLSENYILMNDINVQEDNLNFGVFSGTFDGNFHSLDNQNGSLFSTISGGNIYNLALKNVNVEYAALANVMYCGSINNCFITGSISGKSGIAGGLIAEIPLSYSDKSGNCFIYNCYNMADVTSTREAGGIIGKIVVSNGMDTLVHISACENCGQISGNDGIGGILGSFEYAGIYEKGVYGVPAKYLSYTLSNCFNYASVEAVQTGYAGGLAGKISVYARWEKQDVIFQISQCANYGNITASQYKNDGGICGKIAVSSAEYYNNCAQINIQDCFNAGGTDKVNANLDGGICGNMETNNGKVDIERCLNIGESDKAIAPRLTVVNFHEGIVTVGNCYCTEGQIIWDGVKKLTDKEIKNPENLNDFDFSEMYVWKIDEYMSGYPRPLYSQELRETEGRWEKEDEW